MADLIDRQKAIDALCKSECGWNNAECRHKDDTDFCVTCDNVKIIKSLPSVRLKYTKADYIMALHKEYGCTLIKAEEAHNKALEFLRNEAKMKG